MVIYFITWMLAIPARSSACIEHHAVLVQVHMLRAYMYYSDNE